MQDKAIIFDIKRDCSEDGPGIRTTVFFKGCPLSCVWCQNPESKEKHIESWNNSPNETTIGYWITLEELLYRILIDKPFYNSSGGGVTLSGGEVTQQLSFVHRLLKALKKEGVHTAIETSGFFNYRRFKEKVLPWVDLIYFDFKLIDEAESRQYTGQSSQLILNNFTKLINDAGVPVIPRIPLIPGITTTEKNLRGIANFLASHNISSATLLPYNPLWHDKAIKLGRSPAYKRTTFMTPKEKEVCVGFFKAKSSYNCSLTPALTDEDCIRERVQNTKIGKRRVSHAN